MKTRVADWLARIGADREAVDWARAYGASWERAWAECPRGDWLLSIAARTTMEPTAIVRAASACARLALPYIPTDDARALSLRALDEAEDWAFRRGATASLVARAAELEQAAEHAPDRAAATAIRAVRAACRAVLEPAAAPMAAVLAIESAVLATGECAAGSALGYMQRKTADAVRTHVARQLVKGPLGQR